MNRRIIFFVGLILTASGTVSPPIALLAGIAYGFTEDPVHNLNSGLSAGTQFKKEKHIPMKDLTPAGHLALDFACHTAPA